MFEDLHLFLRGPHLLKMLRDGLLQFLLKSISLRLRPSMHSHRRTDFSLSAIPNGQRHTQSCRDGFITGLPMILADHRHVRHARCAFLFDREFGLLDHFLLSAEGGLSVECLIHQYT